MCLGGGGSDYQYKEPVKYMPAPGPTPGPDTVNDIPISDTGNYNRTELKASKKATPSAQSSKNTGLY